MLAGYLLIAALLPIFVIVVFVAGTEVKQVQGFHEVLEKKIDMKEISLPQTSMIKASDNTVISEISQPVNRINLDSAEIPLFLKKLFIVSEDQHFYDHPGFDLPAIGRALATNMQSNDIKQGASTITQQLARNLYLNTEKSYNRKLSELLYAYEIERNFSKEEILELYINAIYFQNGVYGIEAASEFYFQKQTKDLSRAELAFLASIPNNPSMYNPLKHFDRTKERQERLIDQLSKQQLISLAEAEKIKNEPILLNLRNQIDLYPDYVTYVEEELTELIAQEERYDKKLAAAAEQEKEKILTKLNDRVKEVIASGIIIETALDTKIQEKAHASVKNRLPYKDIEGAAVIINHEKHQIVALIGGKHYQKYNFNRSFQAYRQPGSAIKPLLVYAPYLERTKASLQKKINAGSYCKNGYCPKNYGGGVYGMVSLERAFIYSYNTPAVRLLESIGVENGFNDLANFQFSKVSTSDHMLSAALGGLSFGMTPLELTSAYTTFANNGMYQPSRAIIKVTNKAGKVLYSWKDSYTKIWSNQTTDQIRELMKKTIQSGTAKKIHVSSGYAGGKTGTTNDYKDYWFIGMTDQYTAGVWIGKDKPENMKSIQSAAPQQLIWKDLMSD